MDRRDRTSRRGAPLRVATYLGLGVVGVALSASSLGCSKDAEAAADNAATPIAPATPTHYDPRQSLAPMIKAVGSAVVAVDARGPNPRAARRGEDVVRGRGSGFIVDDAGLVVTNHHVVEGAPSVQVRLPDGRKFEARVIGSDPATDLALLRLEGATELPVVTLGDSRTLEVGDWVVAMGNPMGLEHSATVGILSGKGRGSLGLYRDSYIDFLQTDADIAPGSSGGPLFNLRGEVVGINTAVGSQLRPGFSIPIDQAKRIVEQLRDHGEVVRGWLGASSVPGSTEHGAAIGAIYEGTPAARAGLQSGDIVEQLDGQPIEDFEALRGRIGTMLPGDEVQLQVRRDGELVTLDVTLDARPESDRLDSLRTQRRGGPAPRGDRLPFRLPFGLGPDSSASPESSQPEGPRTSGRRLGISAKVGAAGVEVLEVRSGSLAETLGLQPGDILRELDGVALRDVADVAKALAASGRRIELRFERDGVRHVASLEE